MCLNPGVFKDFHNHCCLVVRATEKTVEYVTVDGPFVVLKKAPLYRFTRQFDTPFPEYPVEQAVDAYLTGPSKGKGRGVQVTDEAAAALAMLVRKSAPEGTKVGGKGGKRKFKVLKKTLPHREGTSRAEAYGLLMECISFEEFLSLGGKQKYLDMWVGMGYISC